MKFALYARVSTIEQSAQMQLEALRKYAAARDWVIHAEYVDEGFSGAKFARPALDRMLDDVRKRRVDGVAVWKFDRLARSTKQLLTWMQEFRALGVQFCSYTENVDTSTPMGEVMFTILAAFGQFERDLIRERVTAGVRKAIEKRGRWGRQRLDLPHVMPSGSIRAVAMQLGISRETVRRRRAGSSGDHRTAASG